MKRITMQIFLLLILAHSHAQTPRQILDFEFEGVKLNGVLNLPQDQDPKGLVLLVHGSGRTNAVAQEWYSDIRGTVVKSGYGIYMWDKMGCGKSGGTFNYNQTVYSSAAEVIAAITILKKKKIPGSEKVSLLGFSRAGWINPIVISEYKDIEFWISVSGVDDKENFGYLLRENLRIEGLPEDSVEMMVHQWKQGNLIYNSGGSFETYWNTTTEIRKNPFFLRFVNGTVGESNEEEAREQYYQGQPAFMKEKMDEESGLQVLVEDFDAILSNVDVPVLALFGENDRNVDWKKTQDLYERTLGKNTELTVKSFPGCNHNMFLSKTGGFYEFQDNELEYKRCDGFLEAIGSWLEEK